MKFNNLVYCSHWEGWQIIDEENVKYWNMDSFKINNYQTEINSYLINDEIFTWCVMQILIKLHKYVLALLYYFCLNFRLNNTLLTIHIIRRSTLLTIHIIRRSTLLTIHIIRRSKLLTIHIIRRSTLLTIHITRRSKLLTIHIIRRSTLLTIHIIRRSTLLTIHIIRRSTLWMLKNIKCNKHCFSFWSPSMYRNKA